jgi:hypothetical protein
MAYGERWRKCWDSRHNRTCEGGRKRGLCRTRRSVGWVAHHLRGKAVEMCDSVQGLCLVASRERCLKDKAADHIGSGANDEFGLAVLGEV